MAVEVVPHIFRLPARPAAALQRSAGRALSAFYGCWRDFLPSAIACLGGIAIAIGGFAASRDYLAQLERRGFEMEASGYAGAVRDAMRQYVEVLNSIATFVSASNGVDRWEFLRFAERTLPRYPGFSALEWVPRVPSRDRVKYEKRAQSDGLFGLRIREFDPDGALVVAGKRPEYYPVYYVEPFAGHDRLLGYDLSDDPQMQSVLRQAEERRRILTVRLPSDSRLITSESNLWFVLPLFSGDVAAMSEADRHQALLGFAIGMMRLSVMVESTLDPLGAVPALELRLTDDAAPPKDRVLYEHEWKPDAVAAAPVLTYASRFDIGGSTWTLHLGRLRGGAATPQDALPWGVALISLLLTGLLFQHLITSALKRRAIERAVQERTAELAKANGELQVKIVERRRAETNLRAAKEQAEIASRAKSEFLAMVSHELKTPLNAIIGFSDILAGQTLGPLGKDQYRDYAADIRDSGHYLLKIINDILDLSRIETGTLVLNEEAVELAATARSAVRIIAPRAEQAGLELSFQAEPGMAPVIVDERAIKQIIVNLLSNAVKFTPKDGKIELTIATISDRPTITVADTGIGIAPQELARIYEPFVQVDTSLARRYEGTGLGLTLTKRLVELHGGRLDLTSTVGSGTTVTVHLPRERWAARQPAA